MTTIIGNGTVLSGGERPAVLADGGVAWQGDRVLAVDRMAALRAHYPEAEVLDARGGLIVPGFVNLHHTSTRRSPAASIPASSRTASPSFSRACGGASTAASTNRWSGCRPA
jgi:cytosine/adenosine deaminase-related metal-dependent hydrolase